jgi:hypothetical protein
MLTIEKYSFGIGDRFAQEGTAQLRAIQKATNNGIPIVPVWNKSNREHQIVKSNPQQTWQAAALAVGELQYSGKWYVDADHINIMNVAPFIEHSNFFTIDVADSINKKVEKDEAEAMLKKLKAFEGSLCIPGIESEFDIREENLRSIIDKFYLAVKEAALIYHRIAEARGNENFVAEISMDEVEEAQTPIELLFILIMISDFNIPIQTIAPKFTGRFNKGVDYVGDLELFRKEFEEDLLVIDYMVNSFDLPLNLKLSVHSGSDKFSIYPIIGQLIKKYDKGIHIKTAGTTWLEEVIGLSMAGGDALNMAKSIYSKAYIRMDELCKPYETVIDIEAKKLPSPKMIESWNSDKFASTLRHVPGNPEYDPMFRQLIHVGYKIASEMGSSYIDMIQKHKEIVGIQVSENIYNRHILRLFDS